MRKLVMIVLLVGSAASAIAQSKQAADPAQALARAKEVMGFDKVNGVVHTRWTAAVLQPYQSDRTYPPFFSMMMPGESWFDPQSGVEKTTSQVIYPGGGPPASTSICDAATCFAMRANGPVQIARDSSRNLNAWLVLLDWSKAHDVRYAGREIYRDYPRLVLARKTDDGEQRLFLDEKSGFPVKLEYTEAHYLWGQRKIEYVFSVWQQSGATFSPGAPLRVADGETEESRTVASVEVLAPGTAPPLALPDVPRQTVDKTPMFLRPLPPKTVDVSASTKILSNPGYREVIARIGDEVYVLDATQGEERAHEDHEIIRQLYPSVRKINVIVTDLAWPHVSGVRYWVANGATIISHRAAESFLKQVLDRQWTLHPDSYEKMRKTAKFKFVGIDTGRELAGGKLKVFPIDGIGSEVALAVYLPHDRFLWASDYIQTLSEPSMYAGEVMAAARRENIQPERVAAEHLDLTDWSKVQAAQEVKPAGSAGGS